MIGFRPLSEADIPFLHRWLNNPVVAEWYGLSLENVKFPTLEQTYDNYISRILGERPTHGYIITLSGEPVGYIQCYRIGDYPEYARSLETHDDSWGIDVFIGEDSARGGGTGAAAVRQFTDEVVFARPEVEVALIAPDPDNKRAVRCYENAGFTHEKTVFIAESNEEEYLMVRRRS